MHQPFLLERGDHAQTRRQRHAGAGREVAGAELAILLAREHQVEHHVPIRARKLGAAEMILTDAARLQAEADLFRSEEHTSELQSLMRISYAVFCLKKKNRHEQHTI